MPDENAVFLSPYFPGLHVPVTVAAPAWPGRRAAVCTGGDRFRPAWTATHKPVIRWHCWARRGAACAGLQSAGLRAAGPAGGDRGQCLRRGCRQPPAGRPQVGSQMLLLAGLAFAAMGLLPLDVDDLHGPASQLHASAWMIWVLGLSPEPCCWPYPVCARCMAARWAYWRWAAACWPRWRVCPTGRTAGARWHNGWRLRAGQSGWNAALPPVAPTLRRLPGVAALPRRAGLETFAALRYAVPLCRTSACSMTSAETRLRPAAGG